MRPYYVGDLSERVPDDHDPMDMAVEQVMVAAPAQAAPAPVSVITVAVPQTEPGAASIPAPLPLNQENQAAVPSTVLPPLRNQRVRSRVAIALPDTSRGVVPIRGLLPEPGRRGRRALDGRPVPVEAAAAGSVTQGRVAGPPERGRAGSGTVH